MNALQVLTTGVVGGVDGPTSAPLSPHVWRRIVVHSTATCVAVRSRTLLIRRMRVPSVWPCRSLLRAVAAVVVVADTGSYLTPVVFLKLVAAASGMFAALVTLAVDLKQFDDMIARGAHAREAPDALSVPLVSTHITVCACARRAYPCARKFILC